MGEFIMLKMVYLKSNKAMGLKYLSQAINNNTNRNKFNQGNK